LVQSMPNRLAEVLKRKGYPTESTATVAYQVDIPKADLVFRGSLDSNWQIAGVLEKRLQPLPLSFAISGRMNHLKNSFRLGCGLMIG